MRTMNSVLRNKTKNKKTKLNTKLFVWTILAPIVLYFAVFVYYPFIKNIYFMFTDYNFIREPHFVGMKNITRVFSDPIVGQALFNTGIITVVCVPLVLIISLFIAILLFNIKKGKGFLRGLIFCTYLTSGVVAAIIFKQWFATEGGIINGFIHNFGIEKIGWFTDTKCAMIAIIALNVWLNVGYFVVVLLAGLSSVNSELFEAAKIDGANGIEILFYIIIPQLKPAIIFSILISTIMFIKTYATVVVLTGGGPYRSTQTILMYMFDQAFSSRNVGYASVIAVLLFVIIAIVSAIQMYLTRNKEGEY